MGAELYCLIAARKAASTGACPAVDASQAQPLAQAAGEYRKDRGFLRRLAIPRTALIC